MCTRVSVVGLGKLGSCMLAAFANAGHTVIGADLDESLVGTLNDGDAPFPEPSLASYIGEAAGDSLHATTDTRAAVRDTDVTFIVVNTPVADDGRYSLDDVDSVCAEIGATLRETEDYHLVVLSSTVFPGATMGPVRDRLEAASGMTAGEEFGLCYSPEFIAIGDVIDGLENPDFFLIGEESQRAGDVVANLYRTWNETVPIARMSPVEAEITKMAVNSYVTTKISFANMLGELADAYGARVDTITEALANDGRISGQYLTAGSRYGGPCFPRDNDAFGELVEAANVEGPIPDATDAMNDQHTAWLAEVVRSETPGDGTVGILGLTYKPNTYIVEESQGMALLAALDGEYGVRCYDPAGLEEAERAYSGTIDAADSVADLVETVDTVVLTVQWPEFTAYEDYEASTATLVDPWRMLDADALPSSVTHRPIGG